MPGSNEYSRSPFLKKEEAPLSTNVSSTNESNDNSKKPKSKLKPKSAKPKWSTTNAVISDGAQNYKVKAGNTLWQIVSAYNKKNNTNLKWQDVAKWSGITDPAKMKIGHTILFADPNTNQGTNLVENVVSEVPVVVATTDSARVVTPDSVRTVVPDSTRVVVTPDSTQITALDSTQLVTPDSVRVVTPDSTQINVPTNKIQDWIKTMKQKGYIQGTVEGGSIAFSDGKGNTFYDNGRMRAKGATNNTDYNYKDLKPLTHMLQKRKKIWSTANPRPFYTSSDSAWVAWSNKMNAALQTGQDILEWVNENPEPPKDAYTPEYLKWLQKKYNAEQTGWYKNGGIMTKKYQQGGAAPQQNMQQQIIALVQAAMQGDQKATQAINQIMEAAKAGDQQATQIAQMIQQVVQQMQGQATAAKWGAKLRYIKSLKYAKGGKACPECMSEGGQTPYKKKTNAPMPKKYDLKKHTRLSDLESNKKATPAQIDSLHAYHKLYRDLPDSIKANVYNDQEVLAGIKPKTKKHYFGGWL